MSIPKLTPDQFAAIHGSLVEQLKKELQQELEDCELSELGQDPTTDLWSPPKVDSKTVVKLSPTVKEMTGWRLKPEWIQKGGYQTVESAVTHVVSQIKAHCVAEVTATATASKAGVAAVALQP